MKIKPLYNVDFIENDFLRGFAEVWTHGIWVFPLAFIILLVLP